MMIRPLNKAHQTSRLHPAFTLVEVLVVMAILVIIAGAGTIGVFKYLDMAKRREADLKMSKIQNAAQTYLSQYQEMPDINSLIGPCPDGTAPLLEGGQAAILDPWNQPFQMSQTQDQFGAQRIVVVSNGSGTEIRWPKQ
ncbi:MAG: type II secretion system protein [Fimbriiglobus sp.]